MEFLMSTVKRMIVSVTSSNHLTRFFSPTIHFGYINDVHKSLFTNDERVSFALLKTQNKLMASILGGQVLSELFLKFHEKETLFPSICSIL